MFYSISHQVRAERLFDLQGLTHADVAALGDVSVPAADAATQVAALCASLDHLEARLGSLAAHDQRVAGEALARAVDAANALDLAGHPLGHDHGYTHDHNLETSPDVARGGADRQEALGGSEAGSEDLERRLRFSLRRAARQYPPVGPSLLARALMAADASTNLAHANPFLAASVANGLEVRLWFQWVQVVRTDLFLRPEFARVSH